LQRKKKKISFEIINLKIKKIKTSWQVSDLVKKHKAEFLFEAELYNFSYKNWTLVKIIIA
jgi:hypothetical protein